MNIKNKAILLVIILMCVGNCLTAQDTVFVQNPDNQNQNKRKSNITSTRLLFKDRVFVDIFSSYWLGLENTVKQKPVNMGCNAAVMFDIPVKKGKPFSFGLGLGVVHQNLRTNATLLHDGDKTYFKPLAYETTGLSIPDSAYKGNRVSFTYLHIPIEFRFLHKSGFKIMAGVRVGVMVDVHDRYSGDKRDGTGGTEKLKNLDIPNFTRIPVEVTFRTGWKFVGLNFSYMLTPMFDKGPKIHPMSFGVSIAIY